MQSNPYKYKGPLEPVKDELVCVPREEDISRLINGIPRGDYWTILGPKQIGKTTLLRQLQFSFPDAHYIYFNFEAFHSTEEAFYQSMMDELFATLSPSKKKITLKKWPGNPGLEFFDFLVKFKPKDNTGKIILMFDEIDNLSFLSSFLHLWRMVFHERYHKKELDKYGVIITGSVDLIAQTIGKTSPFNISEILTMKDFSEAESRLLIEQPFKYLNIQIEDQAIRELMSHVSGHPQLLQHACFLLVESAGKNPGESLTIQDVHNVIEILLDTNTSLDTLKQDLGKDKLRKLIADILDGKKRKYYPYKEYFLAGAGSIKEEDTFCAIRNKVYEDFLREILSTLGKTEELSNVQKIFLTCLRESEHRIVDKISDKLAKSKIEIINHILEFIDKGNVQENKAQEILTALDDVLSKIHRKELALPPGITDETIDLYSQTIKKKEKNLQNSLKLSIPLIPLLLSYEVEIGSKNLNTLKKTWDWLVKKGEKQNGEKQEIS